MIAKIVGWEIGLKSRDVDEKVALEYVVCSPLTSSHTRFFIWIQHHNHHDTASSSQEEQEEDGEKEGEKEEKDEDDR